MLSKNGRLRFNENYNVCRSKPAIFEQLQLIPKELDGPCVVNLIDGGATPILPASDFEAIGYAACVMPVTSTHVIAKALNAFYSDLLNKGDLDEAAPHAIGFSEYTDLVGLPQQRSSEQAYLEFAGNLVAKGNERAKAE